MYRILLADDEGIMLEALKKYYRSKFQKGMRGTLCKNRKGSCRASAGLSSRYMFYGYSDAWFEWNTGDTGNSEV